jgi:hypothetical protein
VLTLSPYWKEPIDFVYPFKSGLFDKKLLVGFLIVESGLLKAEFLEQGKNPLIAPLLALLELLLQLLMLLVLLPPGVA